MVIVLAMLGYLGSEKGGRLLDPADKCFIDLAKFVLSVLVILVFFVLDLLWQVCCEFVCKIARRLILFWGHHRRARSRTPDLGGAP